MVGFDTRPKPPLLDAGRRTAVLGALAALAYLAYHIVSVSFALGPRIGIRSLLTLIAPIFAGAYAYVFHRDAVHRLRRLPAALRFSASLAAGALAMASLRWFLTFYPLPIAELWIASCIAVLAFGSASVPGSGPPLAPYGVAAGMVLYLFAFGVPRIVAR